MRQGEIRTPSKMLLRALLDPSEGSARWSVADMRGLLQHQLKTPLIAESECVEKVCAEQPQEVLSLMQSSPELTFADVLRDASPVRLVIFIKNFAKASVVTEAQLPREVARILYVLAIVRGRRSQPGGITGLDDASVEREARWCLSLSWLPEEARRLIREIIQNGLDRSR